MQNGSPTMHSSMQVPWHSHCLLQQLENAEMAPSRLRALTLHLLVNWLLKSCHSDERWYDIGDGESAFICPDHWINCLFFCFSVVRSLEKQDFFRPLNWVFVFCFYVVPSLEKEDFLENSHILSYFFQLKSVLFNLLCVLGLISERKQSTMFQIFSPFWWAPKTSVRLLKSCHSGQRDYCVSVVKPPQMVTPAGVSRNTFCSNKYAIFKTGFNFKYWKS